MNTNPKKGSSDIDLALFLLIIWQLKSSVNNSKPVTAALLKWCTLITALEVDNTESLRSPLKCKGISLQLSSPEAQKPLTYKWEEYAGRDTELLYSHYYGFCSVLQVTIVHHVHRLLWTPPIITATARTMGDQQWWLLQIKCKEIFKKLECLRSLLVGQLSYSVHQITLAIM